MRWLQHPSIKVYKISEVKWRWWLIEKMIIYDLHNSFRSLSSHHHWCCIDNSRNHIGARYNGFWSGSIFKRWLKEEKKRDDEEALKIKIWKPVFLLFHLFSNQCLSNHLVSCMSMWVFFSRYSLLTQHK